MAIDKIKKSIFLVPQSCYENFLIELKKQSFVEIIQNKDLGQTNEQKFLGLNYENIKSFIPRIESVINLIKKKLKNIELKIDDYIEFKENLEKIFEETKNLCIEIENIEKNIKSLNNIINGLETKKSILEPFEGINLDFQILEKLKNVEYYFLKIDLKKFKFLLNELKKFELYNFWVHKKTKENIFIFLIIYKDLKNEFIDLFKKININIINIKEYIDKKIEDEIEIINQQIKEKKNLILNYEKELKHTIEKNVNKIFYTYYQILEIQDFVSVQKNITTTKYVKIIYCWLPIKFINKLNNLTKKFPEVNVLLIEPSKDEDIPVVLNNKKLFEPYEFITTLYGYPKINSVDPTAFLAGFFTIFFALCLSDVFYGFLLLLLWVLLRKKVSKNSEYYKLITLFKYLGFTSIIVGLFLDSFLGFSILKNFKFSSNIVIFDPLNKPIDMLKFTFLLGFIQIIFGLTIDTFKNFKNKNVSGGIDSLSWLIFIIIFSPITYKLFFPKDIKKNLLDISTKLSIPIFLFIVIYQSRDIKFLFLKPINFFVKAYNTIGYYADILSYSRILALALASSAIAQTINLISYKLFNSQLLGIKYIEPILAVIVFLIGHTFNFVMGILSGLVHSARLQYLEFFSKFFVSGGRPIKFFSPIKNN